MHGSHCHSHLKLVDETLFTVKSISFTIGCYIQRDCHLTCNTVYCYTCHWLPCGDVVGYHAHQKRLKPVPESCLLILLGVLVGLVLYLADASNSDQHQLNTDTFFFILLPPIIIDAGYFMPTRSFLDQLGTIILYAVIGTMVRQHTPPTTSVSSQRCKCMCKLTNTSSLL